MTIYSPPPSLWEWRYNKPTLLVCWWATALCTTIIVLRVLGRFMRTERLFREDKMAALALVPLLLRMGCVHFILRYGTNNSDFTGVVMSEEDLRRREVASGLVLASRILYAATLWILKDSVLEFFRRLTGVTWSRTYEKVLMAIRCALVATFAAVVVSTLAECRPFTHYWQVVPDPGGACRQGFAQLITLAACNIFTDLMLVLFPVPIILRTHMPLRRKAQLVMLFSLSLAVVAVTIYRVPNTLQRHGRQQYRSLLASVELLFATGAANSLVLGSFVRDRGLKKKKYDFGSVGTLHDFGDAQLSARRRPTINRHWGSDDSLVRDLGLGVHPDLRHLPDSSTILEEGIPVVITPACRPARPVAPRLDTWGFPRPSPTAENPHHQRRADEGEDDVEDRPRPVRTDSDMSPRKVVSFYDGGVSPRASWLSCASPAVGSEISPRTSPRVGDEVPLGAFSNIGSEISPGPSPNPGSEMSPGPSHYPGSEISPKSSPNPGSEISPKTYPTPGRPVSASPSPAPDSPPHLSSSTGWRSSGLRLQDLGSLLMRSQNSSAAQTPTAQSPPAATPTALKWPDGKRDGSRSRSRSRPASGYVVPQTRPATIPDPELMDPGGLLG